MPDDTQLAFAHHSLLPVGLSRHCHDNCDPVMTFHHDNPDNHENPGTAVPLR
jgi:hypothetical protein